MQGTYEQVAQVLAATPPVAALLAEAEGYRRAKAYMEGNLKVWVDDEDTSVISAAVCDIYRKVLNVMVTGNPLESER